MMKISQLKRQLKYCFNEYIELMIYQTSLYLIEILSSSSFFESFFANDWAFFFNCLSFIIFKSMIKVNESIRMLSNIFIFSVYTCRMTDLNDYSWSSLLTIMFCFQSFSWFSSSWIKAFILVWALTLTSLNMKVLTNVCRSLKLKIYSITWIKYWSLLVKLWSKHENKWWIKLTSIKRKSIIRLNQKCFWMNEISLQQDSSRNWMTRCLILFKSQILLIYFINWNYLKLCIYMMYFIQSFFVSSSMIFYLIRRMNLWNQ